MTTIHLYRCNPFQPGAPEVFETESLADWLLARYERGRRPAFEVYEGEPSRATRITHRPDAVLQADQPRYVVLESPGLPALPWWGQLLLSVVLQAAVSSIMAPNKPLANRDQESPNNQLSDRQNQVRVMQRVEDIFGTAHSIPSLLMPTYRKYIQNREVEYGLYCVGRGYYDVSGLKDGDTLLSEIRGASAAVYMPFTSPNGGSPVLEIGDPIIDSVVTVRPSSLVSGLVLKAWNQLQLQSGMKYEFYAPGPGGYYVRHSDGGSAPVPVPASSLDTIYQPSNYRRPNFAAVCEVGQTLTISMANQQTDRSQKAGTVTAAASTKKYTSSIADFFRGVVDGTTVVVSGFVDATNNGTKTIVSHTDNSITVSETLVDETMSFGASETITFRVYVNYSGTRTIADVQPAYVTLTGTAQISSLDYPLQLVGTLTFVNYADVDADLTVDNGLSDWTDWFTLPEADRTEVWTNVVAALGLYKDDGAKSKATVAYELQIEQLTALFAPTGVVETVSGSLTGATSSLRAETLEHVTAWTGPARVRARRTTPFDYGFQGFVNDDITFQDLYSVSPVAKTHFGNKTIIHTVTVATQSATSKSSRQLNCIASRKLPTYDGTTWSGAFDATGLLVSGTIAVTSRMVDILAAVTIDPKIGNRPITDLDMAQIWATQQALDAWNTECGQFNYTFDSDSTSYEETVLAIANAAFCAPYRQNNKIRLAFDRAQAASVAIFTHRNKRPSTAQNPYETVTRRFANDAEYDGIEFVYQDPDTLSTETIRLPLDGSATRYKRVEIPGIRSYTQAWFRAYREYRKLLGQRVSIDTDATADARALIPNARVGIVDNTRIKAFDGEVVAQDGLTLTLSAEVQFTPSLPHSIILMRRDGTPESITCTEVAGRADQVLLAAPPSEAVVTEVTAAGNRTIFSFAADNARAAQTWLVQQLGSTDGKYVHISAINYSDDYYAGDTLPVPDKGGVIN